MLFGVLIAILFTVAPGTRIHAQTRGAALTGIVTSAEEGPMEGVLVSAKRTGSNVTVTVVSNAQGRYAFPAAKLAAGAYALTIRASGYDLDGPHSVDVGAPGSGSAGRVDAKTGQLSTIPTPTKNVQLRRGRFDAQDRLWFAEYAGNQIGMYDPNSGKVTEWPLPTPWTAPYDVVLDKHGEAWTGSMWTDRVSRIDVKTGKVVEYTLPRPTNIRRVFVDNTTTPVTFWAGSNHGASIIKLEPND